MKAVFKDARGRGNYNIFPDISSGQINLSYSYPGTIRAFHRHLNQWDNWTVVKGNIEVALYYSDRYLLDAGDTNLELYYLAEGDSPLAIPPSVWHGFRVLGQEEAILLYYVTNKYDPSNPDEERASWDAFYHWKIPKK